MFKTTRPMRHQLTFVVLIGAMLLFADSAFAQFQQQGAKLIGASGSQQGLSVALSADGTTALVGGGWGAWVWTRTDGVWTQQGTKLVGTGAVPVAGGSSVALSADGNTALVGGPGDNYLVGAAWVWTRSGGVWTQQGNKLVGTGAVGAAEQGASVALSADGATALVGGPADNGNAGAVWVWARSGGVWTQQGAKLVATDIVGAAHHGFSVALSADSATALVGGYTDNGSLHGAAWVWTQSGGVWTEQAKLIGTFAGGNQGFSVALSADGNTALVGGPNYNINHGGAWVWTRSGGVWTQQGGVIIATDAVRTDPDPFPGPPQPNQGWSVALSADGDTALIGGPHSGQGAVWVWKRSGGVWTVRDKLVGTGTLGRGAQQGCSVALSASGTTALVGGFDDNLSAGAAWVFVNPPTIFSQDFDGVTAPALPSGWTTSTLAGTANLWVTSVMTPDTAPNQAFASDPATVSDNVLVSPTIAVPNFAAGVTFHHWYDTEAGASSTGEGFDGGVLEIAIAGGAFQDIVAAGGSFVSGGYNRTISTRFESPIAGRQAWSGDSFYVTTTVNLPAAALGQTIVLRWRLATDVSVAATGWKVDTVVLTGCECGNTSPAISSITSKTTPQNTPIAVDFTVGDVESGAAGVSVWASSTNATLVPSGNLTLSGTGASRTVTITPVAGRSGHTTISLTVSDGIAAATSAFDLLVGNALPLRTGDFNGDGRVDVAVFRPSTGVWYVRGVSTTTWGAQADVPVAGDYDGDGQTDIAVYRPSTGGWYILQSSTGTARVATWGGSADTPVSGDYDGDGRTDLAVFRPSTGTWSVLLSTTATGSVATWGGVGDVPVGRDYDGDGKTDVAVFRPSTAAWYILQSSTATGRVATWGGGADIPVAADYDGDGQADVAVFRPSIGVWYILQSSTGTGRVTTWGGGGDIPVPGDYDGDGKTDIAVFRPSNGDWFVINSSTGTGAVVTWGGGGDIPILRRP